jgi:hypothetical protein
MKKLLFFSAIILSCIDSFSQISEGTSGVQKISISKKRDNFLKMSFENKILADTIPPKITLQLPELSSDSIWKSSSKSILVKGMVEDSGGIYDVVINGIEAKVSAEGTFIAEIPQAFGKNIIKIVASDIVFNISKFQFYSERLTDRIFQSNSQSNPISKEYSINILSPSLDNTTIGDDNLNLLACIKSNNPISKIMIYRNNSFINGYLSNKIIQSGECTFLLNEPVTLKFGINDIKIELLIGEDTIKKNITVEYSLFAARNFALLIGNEKYDDPEINDLSEPVLDAKEMYNTLTKDYNFNPNNVILLENPTKAEIIGTLHQLRSKIIASDNLLIFYAGHGYWDVGMGVGYWLPKDALKDNPVNWIPNTDLTNYLGAIKSKHTLLIADACFSGGIFKTRAAFSDSNAIEMLYRLNSRKAITSGTLSVVPDKSIFFQYFIKNLKENGKDYLSSEELFSKMRIAIINNSNNVPQFGTIQNVGDEGGDFIFIKRNK